MTTQEQELVDMLKRMLAWAIQSEDRIYGGPIRDEDMSETLLADVRAARALIERMEGQTP